MISSFSYRTHREKESLEPIEKNHHAAKELNEEAVGRGNLRGRWRGTSEAIGEETSEAVGEELSVADSPSKIHILEGAKHMSMQKIYLWETLIPV